VVPSTYSCAVRKVMFLFLFPVLGVLLLGGVGVTAADAATADDCRAKMDALAAQTASAQFLGAQVETNRAALLAKLEDAGTKLAEGKLEYAGLSRSLR
jgi:hypothetical protein